MLVRLKAFAFHVVLTKAGEILDNPPAELVGQRVDEFIAKQVLLKGGGHPSVRTIRNVSMGARGG